MELNGPFESGSSERGSAGRFIFAFILKYVVQNRHTGNKQLNQSWHKLAVKYSFHH